MVSYSHVVTKYTYVFVLPNQYDSKSNFNSAVLDKGMSESRVHPMT
jgi:hypothetical protein